MSHNGRLRGFSRSIFRGLCGFSETSAYSASQRKSTPCRSLTNRLCLLRHSVFSDPITLHASVTHSRNLAFEPLFGVLPVSGLACGHNEDRDSRSSAPTDSAPRPHSPRASERPTPDRAIQCRSRISIRRVAISRQCILFTRSWNEPWPSTSYGANRARVWCGCFICKISSFLVDVIN